MTVRLFDAPQGYVEKLASLPAGTKIVADGGADVVQFFAASRFELESQFSGALKP
jgi:hypothetical protein